MKEVVLMFNLKDKDYGIAMGHILSQFNVDVRFVDEENHDQTIGYLVGADGFEVTQSVNKFSDEMLVFYNFIGNQVELVFEIFENANLPYIPLKAVTTPNNIEWSAISLRNEVLKEYESLMVN